MSTSHLDVDDERAIDALVAYFLSDLHTFEQFKKQLLVLAEAPQLARLVHSVKARVKNPEHLRNKLRRKLNAARSGGPAFDITKDNLFERINDLAGIQLLHLHTTQFPDINRALLDLLNEYRYRVIEGPKARTWDDEYRNYFRGMGVETVGSNRMYTSVHYVVEANTRTKRTAEIQVRTLAEDLWGEVDHAINYPVPSGSLACREQIKVLARVTSGCTRLVDAIFMTNANDGALAAAETQGPAAA